MNKLKSLEDYKKELPKWVPQERWKLTGVACPKCGKEFYEDTQTVFASLPPKKLFMCSHCGKQEYV